MTADRQVEPATIDRLAAVIAAALCWWCDHLASDHVAHRGPCAECWREGRRADGPRQAAGKTLCEYFVVSPELRASLLDLRIPAAAG